MHRAQLVRAPAVAGTFYPAEAEALRAMVERLLAAAEAPDDGARAPKAIVAPHAGYDFSGPTAAAAYAGVRARAGDVTRVVVAGPAHYVPVRGIAVPSVGLAGLEAFETPLGRIPLDRAAIEALELRALPQVVRSDAAHAPEHSLEVQLPFLQVVLGEFALVPLLVGDASPEEVEEVLDALWGGPETLLVVSTDLSHGRAYADARRSDRATCAAIEALRPERLGVGSACGRAPLAGLLRAARARGCAVRTLDLRSSGDTAGPRGRVVGYGAWAVA